MSISIVQQPLTSKVLITNTVTGKELGGQQKKVQRKSPPVREAEKPVKNRIQAARPARQVVFLVVHHRTATGMLVMRAGI